MRKIFLAAIFFIMISTSLCGAVERNEFSLGGIQLNMPYNDVIAMYGQPSSHPGGYAQLVSDVINYGDSVEIGFLGKKVRYVVIQKNNGWVTPSGVHVGMSIDDVIKIYGKEDFIKIRTQADIPDWMKTSGKSYYDYTWTGKKYTWKYYVNEELSLAVSVVENGGKVTGVMIHQITPEY